MHACSSMQMICRDLVCTKFWVIGHRLLGLKCFTGPRLRFQEVGQRKAGSRRRNSDHRGAVGAGGQIFRPRGGWVSGRVIERSIQAGHHPACCDGEQRGVALGERPIPPLTGRQSLQHRAGSRHPRPRPTFGSENVRGIGVRSAISIP